VGLGKLTGEIEAGLPPSGLEEPGVEIQHDPPGRRYQTSAAGQHAALRQSGLKLGPDLVAGDPPPCADSGSGAEVGRPWGA
jgi:hypothetical protein